MAIDPSGHLLRAVCGGCGGRGGGDSQGEGGGDGGDGSVSLRGGATAGPVGDLKKRLSPS
jgi:hypothetical protein